MKTIIARIFALVAFALLCTLPNSSQAQSSQTLAVNSYFGANNTTVLYCQTNNNYANLSQDLLYVTTAQYNVSATYTTLRFAANSLGNKYAFVTAEGYAYPNGSSQGTPVKVTAVFTQLANGQGSMTVTVSNYFTGAQILTSGMVAASTKTGMAIVTK